MRVILAAPRSFCAGVVRAIQTVERALEKFGAPVYVRHEIVHNRTVVAALRARGAIFVEDLAEVPAGARVIFSAHGVGASVEVEARRLGLDPIDGTCPLVKVVHRSARAAADRGAGIVVIGKHGHVETEGTLGQIPPGTPTWLVEKASDVDALDVPTELPLAFVTQTTLGLDEVGGIVAALKSRFPEIAGPAAGNVCFATTNRQTAVRQLAARCELILVFGSQTSSNSKKLRDVAESTGCRTILLDDVSELDPTALEGVTTLGITAGASAPERLIEEFLEKCAAKIESVEALTVAEEGASFPLPSEVA